VLAESNVKNNYIAFGDALLNYYMNIPEPEKLADEVWTFKLKALA
jgi:hypothetical protein